ncbi:hypothetical protein Patl1_12074 [Pistacia atlantica]|uniref:Uncharacterized protein n=1 Tax=Pistacia atlantica TaxID=434234 RepID=A0ACC1A6E1_9ROSI|nr:hypothetical protein Patl1_12074 [Pistacia atlantica]
MFLTWNAVILLSRKKEEIVCRATGTDREPDSNNDKQINEDGENPPATNTHQKNDKPELDLKLDDVNQITSNDIETNGLGGGVQVMEAAQASVGLSDWWVLDKKPRHVVVFALCRLSSFWVKADGVDWWVLDKKPGHVIVFSLCRLSSSDLDSGMYGGAA